MERIFEYIALVIGSVAGLIIVYGVAFGFVELLIGEWRRFRSGGHKAVAFEKIRYDIGFHLLLGLEFLIAADIINTIIRPELEGLAVLAVIVLIRTVLAYFLGREIGYTLKNRNNKG